MTESAVKSRATRYAMVRWDTIEPSRWSAGFAALHRLGFDGVDLPIVWSVHERDDGSVDFSAPRRAVHEVIAAARSAGLRVRVRVGPRCVESERGFGVPARLLRDPAMLARNARRGAVLEPIALVPTPAPSLNSKAFIAASQQWIAQVIEHLVRSDIDAIESLSIGPGTFAPLRADALEGDQHDDALQDSELRGFDLGSVTYASFVRALIERAREAGCPAEKIRASLAGARSSAHGADALGEAYAIDTAAPFPSAGTQAIFHEVGDAIASAPRGVHFDVCCGSAPFSRPLRNRDAASAARVAIAAGAASLTVRYAWAGEGWVGTLLDADAKPHRAAMRWKALFDECSSVAPATRDPGLARASRTHTWFAPVSAAWLAQYDLLAAHDGHDTLAPLALRVEPANTAIARVEGAQLVLISSCENPVRVFDDARRWLPEGSLEIAPGAIAVASEGGAR